MGENELHVAARTLAEMGGSPIRLEGGLLRQQCAELFTLWRQAGLSGSY